MPLFPGVSAKTSELLLCRSYFVFIKNALLPFITSTVVNTVSLNRKIKLISGEGRQKRGEWEGVWRRQRRRERINKRMR